LKRLGILATAAAATAASIGLALAAEANDPPGHERMLQLLQEVLARSPEEHFYLNDRRERELRAQFDRMRPDVPDLIKWEIRVKLGEEEQRLGREQDAIALYDEAYDLLPKVEADIARDWVVRFLFDIGMAYLRAGETENCALHHNAESCILPIRGKGIHVDKAPSRRAIAFFTEALKRAKAGTDPYLSSLWLLNIAYMTVGGYPDEVPPDYLIPPNRLASDAEFPRFENVAAHARVDSFTLSGGVVVEDFDENGSLDLLVSSYDPTGQLQLFLNDGDGTFTDVTASAGIVGLLGGLNMVQGDYDNDGDIDIYIMRGAWLGKGGRHPNSLLRNNGDGTFTDVTFESGLGEVFYPTQTASWADYDNDGDLDLYVGNETNEGLDAPCQLFQNQGNGTFVDVAARAGVENGRFTKAVVWGDYDSDRLPDIYVSNLYDWNRLYRNQGDGTFRDVAPELGVTEPKASFPAWFWDYDNDGVLDIYVSAYEAFIMNLAAYYLGQPYKKVELQHLYHGDGKGGFTDVAAAVNLARPNAPMGANFGDLDNDGYPDFYLGTGYPPYYALMPNVMYWNQGGKSFADVTTAGGFGHLQKGHAIAFADLDGDGDQDVFEEMGGALAGDKFWNVLYRNPGFGNHWLELELVGVRSNRAGIGARIRVDVTEDGKSRTIYKYANSGGSFGANSVGLQMVGLGRAERIDAVSIYWPASDVTDRVEGLSLDRRYAVREGSGQFEDIPVSPR
jgi:tetratricopeptide (TPR) repeat protein